MYIETSGSLAVGSNAFLISPWFARTSGSCLEFFYHMKGKTIGTLNVYTEYIFTWRSKIWSKTGNQSNIWSKAQVTIKSRVFGFKVKW